MASSDEQREVKQPRVGIVNRPGGVVRMRNATFSDSIDVPIDNRGGMVDSDESENRRPVSHPDILLMHTPSELSEDGFDLRAADRVWGDYKQPIAECLRCGALVFSEKRSLHRSVCRTA